MRRRARSTQQLGGRPSHDARARRRSDVHPRNKWAASGRASSEPRLQTSWLLSQGQAESRKEARRAAARQTDPDARRQRQTRTCPATRAQVDALCIHGRTRRCPWAPRPGTVWVVGGWRSREGGPRLSCGDHAGQWALGHWWPQVKEGDPAILGIINACVSSSSSWRQAAWVAVAACTSRTRRAQCRSLQEGRAWTHGRFHSETVHRLETPPRGSENLGMVSCRSLAFRC